MTHRRWAREYVCRALTGTLEMSDYDPLMMPWPKEDHEAVLAEVRRIRDAYGARLAAVGPPRRRRRKSP